MRKQKSSKGAQFLMIFSKDPETQEHGHTTWSRASTAWSWGLDGAPRTPAPCTRTGWHVATFSFHRQQVWHHSEGPGDKPTTSTSPLKNSNPLALSWILFRKLSRIKPLVAEESSQNYKTRFITIF